MVVHLINNTAYTFVATYIPSPFTITFWDALISRVLQLAEGPIILVGHLNVVLSSDLDTDLKLNPSVALHYQPVQLIHI